VAIDDYYFTDVNPAIKPGCSSTSQSHEQSFITPEFRFSTRMLPSPTDDSLTLVNLYPSTTSVATKNEESAARSFYSAASKGKGYFSDDMEFFFVNDLHKSSGRERTPDFMESLGSIYLNSIDDERTSRSFGNISQNSMSRKVLQSSFISKRSNSSIRSQNRKSNGSFGISPYRILEEWRNAKSGPDDT
jgi:hypothetical protein